MWLGRRFVVCLYNHPDPFRSYTLWKNGFQNTATAYFSRLLIPVMHFQQCFCFISIYSCNLSLRLASPVVQITFLNKSQQKPQRSTSVCCSSPSKRPSRPPSASSSTAPGPSFPLPRNRVWADCTSLTLFSVSRSLHSTLDIFQCGKDGKGNVEGSHWKLLLIYIDSALVMFGDMYGRVKARLTAAGDSFQKVKSS